MILLTLIFEYLPLLRTSIMVSKIKVDGMKDRKYVRESLFLEFMVFD